MWQGFSRSGRAGLAGPRWIPDDPAMALARTALLAPLVRWASRRRFPVLLGLLLALLAVDFAVPDPLPFVDEALLALATILVGRVRRRDPPGSASGEDG